MATRTSLPSEKMTPIEAAFKGIYVIVNAEAFHRRKPRRKSRPSKPQSKITKASPGKSLGGARTKAHALKVPSRKNVAATKAARKVIEAKKKAEAKEQQEEEEEGEEEEGEAEEEEKKEVTETKKTPAETAAPSKKAAAKSRSRKRPANKALAPRKQVAAKKAAAAVETKPTAPPKKRVR